MIRGNGKRPAHIIGGIIVFSAGLFLGLANMVYVVAFIKGAAQPVLILFGMTAILAALFRPENMFRLISLILGILILAVGIYGVYDEYYATMDVLHGAGPIVLILAGLLALVHGIGQVRKER